MFNTYTNSLQCPIRVRSYNDYCILLSQRSETSSRRSCASSRSHCCCCYSTQSSYSSFVKPKVSINPGFVLYGLRQSTLIQWPRRLLVDVGVNVGGSRLLGRCCNSEVYSSCGGSRRRNQRFRLRASDESKECCPDDDVEAMISLLSEELIDEDRNWDLVSRVEEKRRVRYGGEVNRGNVRKVSDSYGDGKKKRVEGVGRQEYKRNGISEDVRLEGKYGCEHCGTRKKNSQLESETRRGSELVAGESIYKRKEEREVRPRRTKSSSCSSYYSLASSGEFESDTEDEEEDVEFHRENMRTSEKKFVEQSRKGMKSRKEVSQMHSRRKRDESSNGVGSSYHKQVFEEVENSNQAATLNQRRRRKQSSQTGWKVSESTGNYEEDTEIHEIHVNAAETNSQNQKIFGEREDNRVHSIVIDSERENIEHSQQQLKERLAARYSSEERVSEMRRRTKYSSSQEEGINVLQNFPEATNNQRPPVEEKVSKEDGVRMSTERFSESSKIHDIDIRNTYVLQREEQSRIQEESINVVQNFPEATNNQQPPVEERISKEDGMRMSTERFSESSRIHDLDIRNTYVLQREEQSRIQEVQAGLVSGLQSERRQQDYHIELNPSQKMQSDRMVDLVSKEMQGSETTLVPPSSQLVSRGSGKSYGTGGLFIQEISQRPSETGYPTTFEHPAFVNSQSTGELMGYTTHEDALGSAQRLEQSSEKFVGEFVKKAKHEASASATDERRAESNQLKRQDSRRSSGGSGEKGPSDDLWVTDSAQGTPQPVATEGNAAEGNAILKRSGRSLWGVIADIARLRWGSRAGTPDSSAKPTGKSSPNESVSSATWFSGREHDGSSDDNTKADRVLPQEAASPHQLEVSQTSSRSQFESSDATELKQQSGRLGGVVSSLSSTILEGGSAYYRMPSTSGNQIVGGNEEGREFEFRVSETASTDVPMRLPTRNLKRSPAVKDPSESSPTELSSDQNVTVGGGRRYQARVPETASTEVPMRLPSRNMKISPVVNDPSETGPTELSCDQNVTVGEGRRYQARVPEMDAVKRPLLRSPVVKEPSQSRPSIVSGSSSLREQVEQQQPLSAKSQEETGSTSSGSPLKQRKLQRNKQVVRDSFEEWEEAYRVETERRTVDEIFMREALVEAKKAADIWEVPVGAVLVHDGKIIARGFNLVEDLRDSTAHAEMICIREGSKVLRSWRLADTTLYVTLEPCPMCAGAILQARVNTLVWGAPNKLLGADGSWIRLFPGGEGNGTEVSEKPPPPVHPFHPNMTIRRGVLESECAQTMQQFFQLRRKKKDKNSDPPAPTDHHHHHPSKLLNKMHQVLPFFCL